MLMRKSFPSSYTLYDDQSTELANAYNGSWVRAGGVDSNKGFIDDTYTWTKLSGSTLQFSFTGAAAIVYGGIANGTTYPQATLSVDGSPAGFMSPYVDGNRIIYFRIQGFAATPHVVVANVTAASETNPFILDGVLIVPHSNANTLVVLPRDTVVASTSKSHLGAILVATLGSIAALIALACVAFCFLRRWRARMTKQPVLDPEASAEPSSDSRRESRRESRMQSRAQQQFLASISYRNSEIYATDVAARHHPALQLSETETMSSENGGTIEVDEAPPLTTPTDLREDPATLHLHIDSGARFSHEGGSFVDVPPSYTMT